MVCSWRRRSTGAAHTPSRSCSVPERPLAVVPGMPGSVNLVYGYPPRTHRAQERQKGRRAGSVRRRSIDANPSQHELAHSTAIAVGVRPSNKADRDPSGRDPLEADTPLSRRGPGCQAGAGSPAPPAVAPVAGRRGHARSRPGGRVRSQRYRVPSRHCPAGAGAGAGELLLADNPAASIGAPDDPGHDDDHPAAPQPAAPASSRGPGSTAAECCQSTGVRLARHEQPWFSSRSWPWIAPGSAGGRRGGTAPIGARRPRTARACAGRQGHVDMGAPATTGTV